MEWGTIFAGCIISQPESMQRHLFAFSICSLPAAAAEGVACMWVCIAGCVCVCAVSSVFAFLTLLITICHALDATAAVAAAAEMHQQQINKQHTPKYWQNTLHILTHTHANRPPTWCFLLAICIKDFYARCKQCEGGGGWCKAGTAKWLPTNASVCRANACKLSTSA